MKAVMLMFDTLNRHMLSPYGCDWTHTPNFRRLAEQSVTFDTSYVGSMPCMPARRELHTARPNFLHRAWGPIEPFDDSAFEILQQHGVYTHLTTDHYHYFEDGGGTYHTRYNTWQFNRGQEGDPWIGQVADPEMPDAVASRAGARKWRQDWINRAHMPRESDHYQSKTIRQTVEFLRRNHDHDNWVLHAETFDPHEPFFSHRLYKDHFAEHYQEYHANGGKHFDWPPYRTVEETPEEVEHCRYEYASLLAMCDAKLGDVLDTFDELNLWEDTMLIVFTDHGFFLGERDLWAKIWMPFYEEVAHTPFFVWDPRCKKRGERRSALVQPCLDIPVTLLRFFGLEPTDDMLGKDLAETIASDAPVREAALFGAFGAHANVTDGRHVYMRGVATEDNQPLFEYTHMPTRMVKRFAPQELQEIALAEPFGFTKGCPTMRIPTGSGMPGGEKVRRDMSTKLFDLQSDPNQESPLDDPQIEARMIAHLVTLMNECEAPPEQYRRLGLPTDPARAAEAVVGSPAAQQA